MTCPLEIMIGLHYWTTPGPYAANEPSHANSPAVCEICRNFIERGLLVEGLSDRAKKYGAAYESTEALGVWVNALCDVPFPIQKWIIPDSHNGRVA